MTVVVGILNKQGIALAADSAVTVAANNSKKIYNRANKIFTISKHHPVGAMIYNAASFMDTPWETILKVYRKQLGNQSFPKLTDYKDDFIRFLKSKNYYTDEDTQKKSLNNFVKAILQNSINRVKKGRLDDPLFAVPNSQNVPAILSLVEADFDQFIANFSKDKNKNSLCPEFVDYTFQEYSAFYLDTFNALIPTLTLPFTPQFTQKLFELCYWIIRKKETNTNFTGLVFVGFGDEEIYPNLIPIDISFCIGNRLRYFTDEANSAQITNEIKSAIVPFGQKDVIDTILRGVDPLLDKIYSENFEAIFKKFTDSIIAQVGDANPKLTLALQQAKQNSGVVKRAFTMQNSSASMQKYIKPLMDAVSHLSKEDLSEMSESLVYLTYLKRRFTFSDEGVGGPVDVAIITKGDGFIWIKRKLYFKPELNQFFFDNYFNG